MSATTQWVKDNARVAADRLNKSYQESAAKAEAKKQERKAKEKKEAELKKLKEWNDLKKKELEKKGQYSVGNSTFYRRH